MGPGVAVDLGGERAFLEATAPAIYPSKPASSDSGGCGTAGTSAPGALVALIVGLVRRRRPPRGIPAMGSPAAALRQAHGEVA